MNKRQLGNTDLQFSPLVFGGNVLGWTIDQNKSFEVLDAFVDAGLTFIDTADVYARWGDGNVGGESETVLGNWMKERGNRDKVIIATKVGSDMGQGKKDISKAYISKAVEASLKRLQTDYIDLYQTHWDDDTTPVEETLEAYTQLIKEGKVRFIGASNLSVARLEASLKASADKRLARYESFQPEYNLYAREGFEKEMQQACIDSNLGVVTYFSLASGFLTGKYRDQLDKSKSIRGGSMDKYMNDRGFRILDALDEVAKEHNVAPASVALAWLMERPGVTAPIASATSVEQMNTLAAATHMSLTEADMGLLNTASAY
ncbi:MAG: aldo/keto reductase [Sphingobacteriales bacterium]|nr:MAG: aldo/keto reductase [Sphingobacteriales bacterium]